MTSTTTMKYNQEEFDKLPALLTRAATMDWTGLGKEDLSRAARDGEIRTYPVWKSEIRNPKSERKKASKRQHKYFKVDVARICGLKV